MGYVEPDVSSGELNWRSRMTQRIEALESKCARLEEQVNKLYKEFDYLTKPESPEKKYKTECPFCHRASCRTCLKEYMKNYHESHKI